MSYRNTNSPRKIKFTGVGAAIGLVLGGLVGYLTGNPMVFAGGAMVLGIAIGATLDQRSEL